MLRALARGDRPAFCSRGAAWFQAVAASPRAGPAQRRSRAALFGEAQATVEVATDAVRRTSGKSAQRSSETVHHIVKAEVSALDAKVDGLKGEINVRVGALEAKLDTLIKSVMARER